MRRKGQQVHHVIYDLESASVRPSWELNVALSVSQVRSVCNASALCTAGEHLRQLFFLFLVCCPFPTPFVFFPFFLFPLFK
jgi:hypothetical protein